MQCVPSPIPSITRQKWSSRQENSDEKCSVQASWHKNIWIFIDGKRVIADIANLKATVKEGLNTDFKSMGMVPDLKIFADSEY